MVNKYLQEMPRVSAVFLCNNPHEVVDIINSKDIDILIMDVIMPEVSGFDLLKTLRSDKRYDDIPIIMFTSLNDLESYKRCYELGASDFISKPINIIEFHARLKVAIQSKTSSNDYKQLIEITRNQNLNLMEMNAKLTDTRFHLVQSEKMAAIGNLAAGIAHEINNPMGFVSSNFEILKKYLTRLQEYVSFIHDTYDAVNPADQAAYSDLVEKVLEKYKHLKIDMILGELPGVISDSEDGVKRVTAIVQSLRVFARTVQDDEKDTYILLDIINQVILISNNEIKYVANVHLSIPDNIILCCNKVQIGQVFINILVNAAQAIRSQQRNDMGTITIIAEQDENNIAIHVIDDGPGIPEENLLKLFDPFFTTKDIGQGTGLGLSISYDIIVNKHNGSIDVNTEPGKGTEFIVKLPINIITKEIESDV
jgi:signal transduction histidine kinase